PLRHRGHLQDLRRVVQGRGAPLPGAGRREGSRGRGPRRLTSISPDAGCRPAGPASRPCRGGAPLSVTTGRWSNPGQTWVNVASNTWPWRHAQGPCATGSAGEAWVESKVSVGYRAPSDPPETSPTAAVQLAPRRGGTIVLRLRTRLCAYSAAIAVTVPLATAPALAEDLEGDPAAPSQATTEDDPSADGTQHAGDPGDQDEVCPPGLVPHLLRGTFDHCGDDEGDPDGQDGDQGESSSPTTTSPEESEPEDSEPEEDPTTEPEPSPSSDTATSPSAEPTASPPEEPPSPEPGPSDPGSPPPSIGSSAPETSLTTTPEEGGGTGGGDGSGPDDPTEEPTEDDDTEEPTEDDDTEEPTEDDESEEPTEDDESEEPTEDEDTESSESPDPTPTTESEPTTEPEPTVVEPRAESET